MEGGFQGDVVYSVSTDKEERIEFYDKHGDVGIISIFILVLLCRTSLISWFVRSYLLSE